MKKPIGSRSGGDGGIPIVITDEDLPAKERAVLGAGQRGVRVLGVDRGVIAAATGAIVRRIESLVPQGYALAEIELQLSLEGKIPGIELHGQAKAKLIPKPV